MSFAPITLPIFSQLLEPSGIAPAQDFEESGELICGQIPEEEVRSKVRFIIGQIVCFKVGEADEIRRLSNCLLYTSTRPRDLYTSRMQSSS